MSKQLQWTIGGLVLLIVGFVALQIYLHVDMKQFKEELAGPEPKTETEQPPQQVQVPEVDNRPPQPDDGREYVWHGDHWHEIPVEQRKVIPRKTNKQGTTERLSYYERIYKKYGVVPPPPGYRYRMTEPGVLKLDENRKPILYKEGEPVFDIHKIPGFAPTYEQYQEYEALIRQRDEERWAGNDARAEQLNAEIRQLKGKAQGSIPFVTGSLGVPTHLKEEASAEMDRRAHEVIKQAYIDMGLEHMVED